MSFKCSCCGTTDPGVCECTQEMVTLAIDARRITELTAERDRYRAALQQILNDCSFLAEAEGIAHEALDPKE